MSTDVMTIGLALQERAAAQRSLADLRERISAYAVHDEDQLPPEDANELLATADSVAIRLADLIARINATNSATPFPGGGTVTDALARRDLLSNQLTTIEGVLRTVRAARSGRERVWRSSSMEVRSTIAVDVVALRAQADSLAAERRALDATLQQLSWEVALLDR